MIRFVLFLLFTLMLCLLGYLWHDYIQSSENPLYPAFPRWLSMVCPAIGWALLIWIFQQYEIGDELRKIMLICAPSGLLIGFATWFFATTGGPMILSLPILVPVVATTIYATSILENRNQDKVAMALLFFVIFGSFYMIAYTIVIMLVLVDYEAFACLAPFRSMIGTTA